MASLYVSEFQSLGRDGGGQIAPVAVVPAEAHQVVTFTTTTQSAAFGAATELVRIVASAACYIQFGANPTATTSSMYMPAGVAEYFAVVPGHKVAAVTA